MSDVDKIYRLIEASLNDDTVTMANLSHEISTAAILEVISGEHGGLVRPVDFLDDEDVMALIRTIRCVIVQIGVLMQARKLEEDLGMTMDRLDQVLHLLIEWVTSSAIARRYLPHADGRVELDGRTIEAATSDLPHVFGAIVPRGGYDA